MVLLARFLAAVRSGATAAVAGFGIGSLLTPLLATQVGTLTPVAYVATATATALLVDVARTPIYVWRAGGALVPLWPERGVATAGVRLGTLAGERLLPGLSPARFRTIIAIVIGLLGAWIVYSVA